MLIVPLALRIKRGRFDVFEPIVAFAVAYGVMFVVRPSAMLLDGALVYEGPRSSLDISETFTEMLLLALLGGLGFVGGYRLALGRRLARRHRLRPQPPEARLLSASVLVGCVGLCSYTLVLASSGFADTVSAILRADVGELPKPDSAAIYGSYAFLLLVPASLVVLVVALKRHSAAVALLALFLAGLVCFLSIPSGSRIVLLPLLGGILTLYFLQRSRRPGIPALLVLAAAAVVGSTLLSDLRGRSTRGEDVVETVARATSPSRIASSFTSGPDTEMAPVLAAALAVIPERQPYTYGNTIFGDLVVRPIPRSLWEAKPLTPRKKLISTIWPIEYRRGTVNAEFSALLYFYWDFGLVGVLVGLALYGFLSRYLYEFYLLNQHHAYAQVFFALALWFVVIGVRDSPVDTFVRACFVLAPVWGIFILARLPLTERSQPPIAT